MMLSQPGAKLLNHGGIAKASYDTAKRITRLVVHHARQESDKTTSRHPSRQPDKERKY